MAIDTGEGLAMTEASDDQTAPPGSPLALLIDLEREMIQRAALIQLYEDYYEGRHQLAFVTDKFRETFGEMLAAVNDNWMPLIVRASVERLGVIGIEIKDDPEGTAFTRETWNRNDLDEDQALLFTEASKHGEAYTLTWYDHAPTRGIFGRFFSRRSSVATPLITVEHPAQVIVRREAGDRRRLAAALKRWQESDGTIMATLYLPDMVYRYRRSSKAGSKWEPRVLDGIPAEERNPLGVVPITPVVNDPHMLPCWPPKSLLCAPHAVPMAAIGLGRSDLADCISTQDQINLLLCHFMVNSEYRSFQQRWATGLEIPKDPDTKQPIQPFKQAVDRLWVTKQQGAKFGAFPQDDPEPIIKGIDQRIMSMSARTRVPSHYLPRPTGQYPSGESLKAAETGLVAKCADKKSSYGGGLKRTQRLAFLVAGDAARANAPLDLSWRNIESRTESEFVDSLIKKLQIGVPVEQLWIDYGYSAEQRQSFRTMLQNAALEAGLSDFPAPDHSGLPDEVDAG